MAYDYSENILVQEAAGEMLEQELGWDVVWAYDTEVLGENGTLGRKSYQDILLKGEIAKAIKHLNPWVTDKHIASCIEELEKITATSTALQINEEKYRLIRDGIEVERVYPDGHTEKPKVKLINFADPLDNHFLAVKEMKIHSMCYHRRTDIVGFVNGLPLLFVELKATNVDVENAYTDNYTDYQQTIPQLFYYNAFLMLSNGDQAKIGTLGSSYKFFHEWKRLSEDEEQGSVALETMLRGICNKKNFLDLFENFLLYDTKDGRTAKILARNHQYLGVNEAFESYLNRQFNNGKLGVFWHTQGSGKSYSMVFLAEKIKRKTAGTPTIVIITDREELNTQISGTFLTCRLLGNVAEATSFIAKSGDDLKDRLKTNTGYIFTLIQKFNDPKATPITPDHDILLISDEAHRSQNGYFAENMVKMLPKASRIGFTGTPLFSDDNITERTFGSYVSIYDFKRAVDDNATVPLIYENRAEKIEELKNPDINEKILQAIEDADLDVEKQERLEQEFAKEVHLLTAEPRLRTIARDFVKHYTSAWESGKAMMVCLNKVSCVRMYNYVQEYWAEAIKEQEAKIKLLDSDQQVQEETLKLNWLKETQMRVVVSQEQNELQTFQKWGLDIKPHRKLMEEEELDKQFKDSNNPFRIVFVCAMWLTGFDVPSLACLYLDKPMKAHTLMQTIARANRTNEGKENGLILDYVGVVKALRNALAQYTASRGGKETSDPTIDKSQLMARVQENIDYAKKLLSDNGFTLQKLITETNKFKKIALLKDAENAICEPWETRKNFNLVVAQLLRMWKLVLDEDASRQMHNEKDALKAIYKQLHMKKHVDITDLSVEINRIISENVEVKETGCPSARLDISKIDFYRISAEFAKERHKQLMLKALEDLLGQTLCAMVEQNPNRINFYEKYQSIIKAFNAEQNRATIEQTFAELLELSDSLSTEQQRYVREGLDNEEQLYLFDVMKQDNISKEDIQKLKEISKTLLEKIKKLVDEYDHPFDKPDTKAQIQVEIKNELFQELPDSCFSEQNLNLQVIAMYEYIRKRYIDTQAIQQPIHVNVYGTFNNIHGNTINRY